MAVNLLEAKVLKRVRDRLLADATVLAIVSTRIADWGKSTVAEPEYPALTLGLLSAAPADYLGGKAVRFGLQVDAWVRADDQPKSKAYELGDAVRDSLHGFSGINGGTGIISMVQTTSGEVLYEPDTHLWHLPMRFQVLAIE